MKQTSDILQSITSYSLAVVLNFQIKTELFYLRVNSICTLGTEMFALGHKQLETTVIIKSFDPSLLPKKLWMIFIGMKQKSLWKENPKRPTQNLFFQNTKNSIFSCFRFTSDSLTTIYVEPHQCPSHQFLLFTQSLKCLRKNIENWRFWKTQFFRVSQFGFFLLHPHENQSKFQGSKDESKFWWLPWFLAVFDPGQTFLSRVYS